MDLEQLRKRVKEAERKSTRAEHDVRIFFDFISGLFNTCAL